MKYKIDATNKILGRLATEIVLILRGKNKPGFAPNKENTDIVEVIHAAKVKVSGKKEEQKLYFRYTGYPGGIKRTTYREMLEKHPERILWKAVYGMLPKNRMRSRLLKHLIIKTNE